MRKHPLECVIRFYNKFSLNPYTVKAQLTDSSNERITLLQEQIS